MEPGRTWGEPLPPDATVVDVTGDDTDLVAAVDAHPGAVLAFASAAESDFARSVGLTPGTRPTGRTVLACDLLDLGHGRAAVNAVVMGCAPDRLRRRHRRRPVTVEVDGRIVAEEPAVAVVVANGQFLRGADLVPRGHPGDGRAEVQVYTLRPGERAAMRRRLAVGAHLPHPRILQATGRRIDVHWPGGEQPLEIDGRPLGNAGELTITVRPGAARLLV